MKGSQPRGRDKDTQELVLISAHIPADMAKAARIAAIQEGIRFQDWIGRAVIRELAGAGRKTPGAGGNLKTC